MTLRAKILAGIGYTVLIFAVGRYTVTPAKVSESLKETEQVKQAEDKHIETKKTITETKKPDGSSTTVTVIDQKVEDEKETKSALSLQEQQSVSPRKTFNLSILGADNIHDTFKPVYGLSLTKQVLGPVTVGAFGFQNGSVGISLGLNF